MAKTIEQWYLELKELDDSINATKYAQENDRLIWETNTMSEAINEGFVWSQTPEGVDHWNNLYVQYQRQEAEQEQSTTNN